MTAADPNEGNDHTIAQRSSPSSPPSTPCEDEVLYCHFIPKKEFVEKGTPWIIHSKAKCFVCSSVQFESMAMMRTAGPGGEAPDPVVCKCGVSRHHLRVEGYVVMSAEDTPHPVATIKSHRVSSLANVPAMERAATEAEQRIKELSKKTQSQAAKLKSGHEEQAKLRQTNSDWKKRVAQQEAMMEKVRDDGAKSLSRLKQKDLQMASLTSTVR